MAILLVFMTWILDIINLKILRIAYIKTICTLFFNLQKWLLNTWNFWTVREEIHQMEKPLCILHENHEKIKEKNPTKLSDWLSGQIMNQKANQAHICFKFLWNNKNLFFVLQKFTKHLGSAVTSGNSLPLIVFGKWHMETVAPPKQCRGTEEPNLPSDSK